MKRNLDITRHAELVSASSQRTKLNSFRYYWRISLKSGQSKFSVRTFSIKLKFWEKKSNKFGMTFLFLIILFFQLFEYAEGASAPLPKIEDLSPSAPAALSQPIKPISVLNSHKTETYVSPIMPQSVDFSVCTKFFKMDSQRLFYLTLAAVNANRFSIDEIQSKSGNVLFTAAQKQFLASVINIDSKNSMLKITPCSNIYVFPVGVVQNMFKYVELNINTPIENLKSL